MPGYGRGKFGRGPFGRGVPASGGFGRGRFGRGPYGRGEGASAIVPSDLAGPYGIEVGSDAVGAYNVQLIAPMDLEALYHIGQSIPELEGLYRIFVSRDLEANHPDIVGSELVG